jgi:hypothetical protein
MQVMEVEQTSSITPRKETKEVNSVSTWLAGLRAGPPASHYQCGMLVNWHARLLWLAGTWICFAWMCMIFSYALRSKHYHMQCAEALAGHGVCVSAMPARVQAWTPLSACEALAQCTAEDLTGSEAPSCHSMKQAACL